MADSLAPGDVRRLWLPLPLALRGSALLVALFILFWGLSRTPEQAFDDAYITYRYADNLRQGQGLLYNPGEWVLGTTTPLFALLLALLGTVIPDLEFLGHWVGVFSWVAAAWAAIALFRQAERPLVGIIAGMLVALLPAMLGSLGMETPLLVALMLGSAWAWLGGRQRLALLLLVALILTRQDAALWLLFLGLERWRATRRLPWREALAVTLLTLPWFGYAWWRYGSILPNSALAKIGQSQAMAVEGYSSFLLNLGSTLAEGLSPLALVFYLGSLLVGLWVIARQARQFWWLPGWLVSYCLIYQALQVVSFPWYFVPPLVALHLLAALGIGAMAESLGGGYLSLPLRRALTVAFLALFLLNQWQQLQVVGERYGYRPEYRESALWLARNAPPQATVATIEIGVLGYFSQRPILDTMGLVSPQMTTHLTSWSTPLLYALSSEHPAYLVTLPGTAWDSLIPQWWFQRAYRPAASFGQVTIYERVEEVPEERFRPESAFAGGITLAEVALAESTLEPGATLEVELLLEVDEAPTNPYEITLFFVDAQSYERRGVSSALPFEGLFSTVEWQPGDRLTVPARLRIPPDLLPGTYQLGIVLYDTVAGRPLPLKEQPTLAEVQVGWLRSGTPPVAEGPIPLLERQVSARWEEGIELVTVALPEAAVRAGSPLPLGFTWQTVEVPGRNLTLFVHLLNQQGEIVAQQDQRPFQGRFPTTVWQPGEPLSDLLMIPLPDSLPEGSYDLRLGFYDENGPLRLGSGEGESLLLSDMVRVGAR